MSEKDFDGDLWRKSLSLMMMKKGIKSFSYGVADVKQLDSEHMFTVMHIHNAVKPEDETIEIKLMTVKEAADYLELFNATKGGHG